MTDCKTCAWATVSQEQRRLTAQDGSFCTAGKVRIRCGNPERAQVHLHGPGAGCSAWTERRRLGESETEEAAGTSAG